MNPDFTIGQEVAVIDSFNMLHLAHVVRYTPTQVIVEYGSSRIRFNKLTRRGVGVAFHTYRLYRESDNPLMLAGARRIPNRQNLIRAVRNYDFETCRYDQLTRIIGILGIENY